MPERRMIPLSEVWVGPRLRLALPPDLLLRAANVYDSFGHFFQPTFKEWHDGFCHDVHPEREIAWWERLSLFFHEYLAAHPECGDSPSALRQLAHECFCAAMER